MTSKQQNTSRTLRRFQIKSNSSMERYSSVGKESIDSQKGVDANNEGTKEVSIPLVLKKMNSVEKYVNSFKSNESVHKRSRRDKVNPPLFDRTPSGHMESLYSQTPGVDGQVLSQLQQKCYVKYHSTSMQHSESKAETLEDLQDQYLKLKRNIIPERRGQIVSEFSNPTLRSRLNQSNLRSNASRSLQKNSLERIDEKDVQKQLKNSTVHENGQSYFADLYLMKREREKVLNSIFEVDHSFKDQSENPSIRQSQFKAASYHHTRSSSKNFLEKRRSLKNSQHLIESFSKESFSKKSEFNQTSTAHQSGTSKKLPRLPTVKLSEITKSSHSEKMKKLQQDFVQEKILKERSLKKSKMLKGRNMNWNVYYEMLALDHRQKRKLKSYCKFSQTYGVD